MLALKGIGGYHLACRADLESAVASLRSRKHREDKPFALMAPGIGSALKLVELDEAARELLCSPQRPIVLAPRAPAAPVAESVTPGAPELGVMLPYSPLHHLLLADVGQTLVMTSGNSSDEPIAYQDEDALTRLAPIADLFAIHDRAIETRTDDSVVRVFTSGKARRTALPAALAWLSFREPAAAGGRSHPAALGMRCGARRARSVLPRGRERGSLAASATWRTIPHYARSSTGSITSSGCSLSCPKSLRMISCGVSVDQVRA